MKLIIDGYNVLKQEYGNTFIAEKQRVHFIKQLEVYGKKKNHLIIVVFDGGPFTWSTVEEDGILKVVYAGAITADDYIKKYLSEHKNKQSVVISSDRELVSYADAHNTVAIRSTKFYEIMQRTIAHSPQRALIKSKDLVKLSAGEDHELDEIMHAGSAHIPDKDEGDLPKRQKEHAISKKERKLLQVLEKL